MAGEDVDRIGRPMCEWTDLVVHSVSDAIDSIPRLCRSLNQIQETVRWFHVNLTH